MSIQNKSFLSDTVNKFSFNEIPSWHKITIWGATLAPGTVSSPAWFHPSCNTIITDIHYNSESLKCFKTWKNFPPKNKIKTTSIYILYLTKQGPYSSNRHVLTFLIWVIWMGYLYCRSYNRSHYRVFPRNTRGSTSTRMFGLEECSQISQHDEWPHHRARWPHQR